jgi:anti-anti-sigma factor
MMVLMLSTQLELKGVMRMLISKPVVIMQLPEELNRETAQNFMLELRPLLESHRPQIVLDCSYVRYIDGAGVEMLLQCLEEAMKRDGDLKLSAVSRESEVILQLMRVDRVFEVFPTSEGAVRSFSVISPEAVPQDAPLYHAGLFGDVEALKQAS